MPVRGRNIAARRASGASARELASSHRRSTARVRPAAARVNLRLRLVLAAALVLRLPALGRRGDSVVEQALVGARGRSVRFLCAQHERDELLKARALERYGAFHDLRARQVADNDAEVRPEAYVAQRLELTCEKGRGKF